MPRVQRGAVVKRGTRNYQARWRDDRGKQHGQGGFETSTAAWKWLDAKVGEIVALRRGELIPVAHRPGTVAALLDLFEEKHGRNIDPATLRTVKSCLRHARREFAERHPDSLNRLELEDWRVTLSPGTRHQAFRVFRQALAWGVARGLIARDASVGIKNPKRRRHERRDVHPFESWAEVEAVADELPARLRVIPFLAVGCGLGFGRRSCSGCTEPTSTDMNGSCGSSGATPEGCSSQAVRRPALSVRFRFDRLCSTHSTRCLRGSTLRSSSRPYAAATSTSSGSATANGRLPYGRPDSTIGGSTSVGTRSQPGRSRTGYRSGSSPRSWARPWCRSKTPMRAGSKGPTRSLGTHSMLTTGRRLARRRADSDAEA